MLAGFANWFGTKYLFGSCLAISWARSSAPSIPFEPSLSMTLAPKANSIWRLSLVMVSGITRSRSYPFTRQTKASPIPVFPLVGSMTVIPFFSFPFFSASSIMYLVMRSLTEPPGLNFSSFRNSSRFGFGFRWFIRTIGVFPIKSRMLSTIICFTVYPFLYTIL